MSVSTNKKHWRNKIYLILHIWPCQVCAKFVPSCQVSTWLPSLNLAARKLGSSERPNIDLAKLIWSTDQINKSFFTVYCTISKIIFIKNNILYIRSLICFFDQINCVKIHVNNYVEYFICGLKLFKWCMTNSFLLSLFSC